MELFSEIHSRYYYIINQVLKASEGRRLKTNDIAAIVANLGFSETSLTLTPALLNTDQNSYRILKKDSSGYILPVAQSFPPPMLTTLQKRWLKTIIADKRFKLFTVDEEYEQYLSLFSDVEPLYDQNHLLTIDMANDGDNYENKEYKNLFSTVLTAIQTSRVLLITYESGKGNRLSAYFAPYKLEYSMKDDKFRLVGVRIRQKKLRSLYKLNLSRITSLSVMDWNAPPGLGQYIQNLRMPEPVEIEITNERNGFERIFTQLSNFERISEYDESKKICHMKIYYYEVDEMELLITLLSFGPVIRILGPASFKKQFVERVTNQIQLFPTHNETKSC